MPIDAAGGPSCFIPCAIWSRRSCALTSGCTPLWGCESFYGRSLAEISEPFDTVYTSFYKQLGGLAGAVLAGSEDVIAESKEWRRRRYGGLLPTGAGGDARRRRSRPCRR